MKFKEDTFRMKFASKLLIKLVICTTVVMSVLAFQGMHSTVAHAATQCYGATCNNYDPTTTVGPHNVYCNKNAYRQEHKDYSFGWIENWWSAECNANWTVTNVNSGYYIGQASADACSSGATIDSSGSPSCNGYTTDVCDYLNNNTGWKGWCWGTAYYSYVNGDIPAGVTHWYTNMVRGDESTISFVSVSCSSCWVLTMQTGWH